MQAGDGAKVVEFARSRSSDPLDSDTMEGELCRSRQRKSSYPGSKECPVTMARSTIALLQRAGSNQMALYDVLRYMNSARFLTKAG